MFLQKKKIRNHYKITPIQIYRKFHLQNLKNFRYSSLINFHIFVQNIDCGSSLEPHSQGGPNDNPQSMFTPETSVSLRGVKNIFVMQKVQYMYFSVKESALNVDLMVIFEAS